MAPPVEIPRNLPELVRGAFAKAVASGDVNFYPTQATLLRIGGVPVRFFPVLSIPLIYYAVMGCFDAAMLRCCDAVYDVRVMLLVGNDRETDWC